MKCTPIFLGNGIRGFTCSRESPPRAMCQVCKWREHEVLCDFVLRGSKTGSTCSMRLCRPCGLKSGQRDLCPAHARAEAAQPELKL